MKKLFLLGAICLLALWTTLAGAATVTFDSYGSQDTCMPSIDSEGLSFSSAAVDCTNNYLYVWDNSSPHSNGTPALIYGFNGFVAVTQTGGGAFDLNSVEMTLSWYEDAFPSEDITATAHFQGGGTSTMTLTLLQGLQTYNLNFLDVTEVDFSATPSASGYWLMDNVNYNGVTTTPEPGSLVLLGVGILGGIGILRRKRS